MNTKPIEGGDASQKSRMWTDRIAPRLLIGLLFLAPLFFLPFGSFLFDAGKIMLLTLVTLAALSFWVVERLKENKVTIAFNWILTSLAAVALSFVIAAFFSGHPQLGLIGNGFALMTASTFSMLALLAFVVSVFFREKNRILYAYSALVLASLIIGLFHILRFPFIFGPNFLSFGLFTSAVSNTIGSWNDLGIFFGLMALVSFIGLEMLTLSRLFKGLLIATLCVSVVFLALVNYLVIWYVLGIAALLFFMSSLLQGARGEVEVTPDAKRENTPSFLALGLMILCFIFIIANAPIKNTVSSIFNISFVEARPGFSPTFDLFKASIKQSPIFGVGPNQFKDLWLLNKPAAINQTVFWNTDFTTGVGYIPTAVIMTGIIGLLAWLWFIGSFLYYGFTTVFSKGNTLSQFFLLSGFFGAAYLWAFSIFYVPGIVVLILTFFFTGLFVANLKDAEFYRKSFSFGSSPRVSGAFILLSTVALMAIAGWVYVYARDFASASYFASANYDASIKQDLLGAEAKGVNAATLTPNDEYYRFIVSVELARLQALAADQNTPKEALQAQLQTILSNAVSAGNAAVAYNSSNYLNSLALGQVYEWIIPLKITETAYENAMTLYTKALQQNPNSPAVLLFLSRLEATKGDYKKATEYINQALTAKPDYLDAVFLLAQIQVAQGDSAGAIRSVQAATTITPNNPTLWFQLGVLRYSAKDYTGAASALEQAVAMVPDYANAKYFLGLSYDKANNTEKAIALFEDLQKGNPDNQEINLILNNLKNGKDAFADAKPPVDATPEKRKELPLKEKATATTDETTSTE